ncbi:MAG: hypothetical protein ACLU62_03225 [Hydrogeniiclostridium sp.]
MKIKEYALEKAHKTEIGSRLIEDKHYRVIAKAVLSLVFNLLFAFYNGILGFLSSSLIFIASSIYYLLLSSMRFSAVLLNRKGKNQNDRLIVSIVGVMLIILSVVFHIMVIVSMEYNTATLYGTITMIAIATFTFTKIAMAVITAVKHKGEHSKLFRAINAIRYSEVAVSLLTMQQSMLVSFEGADEKSSVILNACTGAGVCFFILALGIITLKNSRKETE